METTEEDIDFEGFIKDIGNNINQTLNITKDSSFFDIYNEFARINDSTYYNSLIDKKLIYEKKKIFNNTGIENIQQQKIKLSQLIVNLQGKKKEIEDKIPEEQQNSNESTKRDDEKEDYAQIRNNSTKVNKLHLTVDHITYTIEAINELIKYITEKLVELDIAKSNMDFLSEIKIKTDEELNTKLDAINKFSSPLEYIKKKANSPYYFKSDDNTIDTLKNGIEEEMKRRKEEKTDEIQNFRKTYPNRLEITLKTNIPGFQETKFLTTMLKSDKRSFMGSVNNANVFFTPTIQLHKNIIQDIPIGYDKEYLYTQFFEKNSFDTLVNRTGKSIRGMLQNSEPTLDELKNIIKQNINNTLWALFNENNILNIGGSAYAILDYEWNVEDFFNENRTFFDTEKKLVDDNDRKYKTEEVPTDEKTHPEIYINTLKQILNRSGSIDGFDSCYKGYKNFKKIELVSINKFRKNANNVIREIYPDLQDNNTLLDVLQKNITEKNPNNVVMLFYKIIIIVLFYSYNNAIQENEKLIKTDISNNSYDEYDKFEFEILKKKYEEIIQIYILNFRTVFDELKSVYKFTDVEITNTKSLLASLENKTEIDIELLPNFDTIQSSKSKKGGDPDEEDLYKKVREKIRQQEILKKYKDDSKKNQSILSEKTFKVTVVLVVFKGPSVSTFDRASFLCQAKLDKIKYGLSKVLSPKIVGTYVPGVYKVSGKPQDKDLKSQTVKNKEVSTNQLSTSVKTVKNRGSPQ